MRFCFEVGHSNILTKTLYIVSDIGGCMHNYTIASIAVSIRFIAK